MVDEVPIVGNNAQGELKALDKNIQNSLKKSTLEKIKVGNWLIQARERRARAHRCEQPEGRAEQASAGARRVRPLSKSGQWVRASVLQAAF